MRKGKGGRGLKLTGIEGRYQRERNDKGFSKKREKKKKRSLNQQGKKSPGDEKL